MLLKPLKKFCSQIKHIKQKRKTLQKTSAKKVKGEKFLTSTRFISVRKNVPLLRLSFLKIAGNNFINKLALI